MGQFSVTIFALAGSILSGNQHSLVSDLINPIIGLITGGVDFSNLFIDLSGTNPASLAAAREAGAPVFAYGAFITAVINFLIIAWVVFLIVKGVNRLKEATQKKQEAEAAAPAGPTELDILMEIRDSLKK